MMVSLQHVTRVLTEGIQGASEVGAESLPARIRLGARRALSQVLAKLGNPSSRTQCAYNSLNKKKKIKEWGQLERGGEEKRVLVNVDPVAGGPASQHFRYPMHSGAG